MEILLRDLREAFEKKQQGWQGIQNLEQLKKIAKVENKIQQEALKKADKTEAGKEYRRVNKTLQELDRQMKEMYGPESQMVLGQEDAMYVNKVYEDYNNTVKKFLKEREDEYYGVYLSVLGYNNTEAGRKYVASILEDWD